MGQQKQPEPELLEIPGAEGIGVDYLTELLKKPAPTKTIPQLEVAGLTGTEQTVQNLLKKYLATSPTESKAYQLGMGELEKTLGGEYYDPRTSDFWKGFRELHEMEQEKGVADIRRRGQLGGGLYSDPNMRTEAEYIRGMGAERTMQLGSLYERERDRMTDAVAKALGYAGFEETGKTSRLQLGSTIGAIPREVEQMKNLAKYQQLLGQTEADYQSEMIPYQYGTAIASQLLPQWYIDQSQPADPLSGFLGIVTSLASLGK